MNLQVRSNNKETAQQLGEMDYVDFHVHRITNDLQRVGVSISGSIHIQDATGKQQQETKSTIAKSHKSAWYLPHWIQDHRDDPALMVCMLC